MNHDFSPIAMEHAQHPHNYGPLANFNGHAVIKGPCGDTMEFWIFVQNSKIEKASFITDGCCSSLTCGSMATSLAEGKNIAEVGLIQQQDILNALGSFPEESQHCALLAANTLKAACEDYLIHQPKETSESNHCSSCDQQSCSAHQRRPDENDNEFQERQKLQARLCKIQHKILVMSGKGGVGKSTVAVNIAVALMLSGKRVGLLDVDIHGPSIPTMLGIEEDTIQGDGENFIPIQANGLKVISIGFCLHSQDDAIIFRGPRKMGVIKQFLMNAVWGDLDYLIIDAPPGTGDEPLSVCQLIGELDGAVVVTTPQKVAAVDVRKSINFCKQLNVPVIGVVENMSGFTCPHCGQMTAIFPDGAGMRIAVDMDVPFLGSIPIDVQIAQSGDDGIPFLARYKDSPTAQIMQKIIKPIEAIQKKVKMP